jgi:mRNA-degrading endonuclease RelE of RelBE toxin-antitoxin system
MALKEISPLNKDELDFVVNKLNEEEKNPNPERLKRIAEARQNASKMKRFYH